MEGEVHIPIGLAAAGAVSLVVPVMQPHSFGAVMSAAVCGAVGALTPDIDANGDSKMKRQFRKFVSLMVLAVAVGIWCGEPLKVLSGLEWWNIIGAVALVICYGYGYTRKHRGFTHELRGLAVFCVPAFLLLGVTDGLWFFVGMLSHQLADMCNYGKIYWLNPVDPERSFSRGWFRGSSLTSQLIGAVSWLVFIGVLSMYLKGGAIGGMVFGIR